MTVIQLAVEIIGDQDSWPQTWVGTIKLMIFANSPWKDYAIPVTNELLYGVVKHT